MEFLVHTDIRLAAGMTEHEQRELYVEEAAQAEVLARAGRIVRLWRVPGRRSNWGLWQAEDATALHEALNSLPLWKYMEVDVIALARHPNDP